MQNVCWANGRGFSLRDVLLTLEQGQLTALMGANGAGKSTVLRLMTGELRPQSGRVLLDGADVTRIGRKQFAQKVAVIRQERAFTFPMSCMELVMTGRTPYLGFMGRSGNIERNMAREALERTGAEMLADVPFEEISGGEKQRVMLARALMQEPKVLLLDEAFSAMDARQAVRSMGLVRSLVRERKMAAMCIVHDIHIAHAFADRIVLMENGRIVDEGIPDAVCVGTAMRRLTGMEIEIQKNGGLSAVILSEEE